MNWKRCGTKLSLISRVYSRFVIFTEFALILARDTKQQLSGKSCSPIPCCPAYLCMSLHFLVEHNLVA
jgi:hypothetical protein